MMVAVPREGFASLQTLVWPEKNSSAAEEEHVVEAWKEGTVSIDVWEQINADMVVQTLV